MADLQAVIRAAGPGVSTLKLARTVAGLSQREVERRAGLPATQLSHLEAGRRTADPATRFRLALALDADVNAIFPPEVPT